MSHRFSMSGGSASGAKGLWQTALVLVSAAFVSACAEPELPDLGPRVDAALQPQSPPPPAPSSN